MVSGSGRCTDGPEQLCRGHPHVGQFLYGAEAAQIPWHHCRTRPALSSASTAWRLTGCPFSRRRPRAGKRRSPSASWRGGPEGGADQPPPGKGVDPQFGQERKEPLRTDAARARRILGKLLGMINKEEEDGRTARKQPKDRDAMASRFGAFPWPVAGQVLTRFRMAGAIPIPRP